MLNPRDHPFNRSDRPLLDLHNNDDRFTSSVREYRQYGNIPDTASQHDSPHLVSQPNSAQLMRGFHDFNYVPKTSFYGGYPYGSPPSPGHQLADNSGGHATHSTAQQQLVFRFSDDSGVHGSSSTSTPNTTNSSSAHSSIVRRHPASTAQYKADAPPPPPQRFYVDDCQYEDDDGYTDSLWRPYGGGQFVAATKGPFVFDVDTKSTRSVLSAGLPEAGKAGKAGKANAKAAKAAAKMLRKQRQLEEQENREPDPVRCIKCVVVGDAAVGKTNLICSYLENRFVGEHIPTASDEYNFDVCVNEAPVRVTLCDTAGQDTLDALRQLSYPDSDVFVLCFSVVRPATYRSLQRKWLPQLRRRAPGSVLLVVGTQADLRSDPAVLGTLQRLGEEPVAVEAAYELAHSVGAKYVETSARYRRGVKDAFDAAIWQALLADRAARQRKRANSVWRRMLCWR